MNWDDLRFVAAVSRVGTLAGAAVALNVDHTTVGRRIAAMERALGLRLFVRTQRGYSLTREGEQLVAPLRDVENAVLSLQRGVQAAQSALEGTVRVTSPETFGVTYLAPRLALFTRQHPALSIELRPSGQVHDLSRREAEVAIRSFRTPEQRLVTRRGGDVSYALYASTERIERNPIRGPTDVSAHPLLLPSSGIELTWLRKLVPKAVPAFVCDVSVGLAEAARAGAGVTVLPRYLGDATQGLIHIPMPHEPTEPLWLTVHRDLRQSPRVRALLDFLAAAMREDRALLVGP